MEAQRNKEELRALMKWHFAKINKIGEKGKGEVHHQHFCSMSEEGADKRLAHQAVEAQEKSR